MNPTRQLQETGQSLWLDNISRQLLDSGLLRCFIDELSITGLTSNPSIFAEAIAASTAYDAGILKRMQAGLTGEALFIDLALEDLGRAAELFLPVFVASQHREGWVSMEISPLLANDTQGSIRAALEIHEQVEQPNFLVKIPGTPAGIAAIEQCIYCGVPVNVTLLFSCEQYLAAAYAYIRGIERRVELGLNPHVGSVASLFVSRWDRAVRYTVPVVLHNRLGIAMAQRCYHAYHELLRSERWQRLAVAGALPQRLLWASTGSKDPQASDTLYVEALAAADTIDTLPPPTLLAFADHGAIAATLAVDGGDAEAVLMRFAQAGVDVEALALRLQKEGTQAFANSWQELLQQIADKGARLYGLGGRS